MKTVLKNKILVLFSMLVMLFCAVFGVGSYAMTKTSKAKADDVTGTPTLTIESNNVSYADSIYILYAVSNDGFDRTNYEIKMLFWEELQEEYTVGTEKYAVTSNQSATVKGKRCLIFYSDGLAAKEMTTDIFARACVEIDGVAYYSDVMKFSVLEYVHTMREKGGLTTNQQNLFNNLLNYGASAQYQFGHNVDRIANGTYYSITIVNGKLPDGFAHGRYQNKKKIKVKADKAPHGMKFSHWEDEKGIIISYDEQIEIELKGNKTYIAVYKDISNVATQLVLNAEIPYDGDVNEVELPTAVSFEANGETVVLEVTWNTENFKTEQIGTQTFYATLVDQSAYDRYNIARDGIVMNVKTMPYTLEIDQTTGEYILTGYYGADTEITLPTSYRNTFITTIKSKAFNQAKTLTKVDIPNTYKKIEQSAFFLCDNIAEITVPFTGESATTPRSNCYFGWIFGATSYDKQYINLPLALHTVNLTEGATKVQSNAFRGCENIENFNLPSTIASIDYYAFYGCDRLTEFTIPDNLTSLGSDVFSYSGLKRVNASSIDKVLSLSSSPFGSGADLYVNDKLITEVSIPVGTTMLKPSLRYCTSITKVSLPDGLEAFGGYSEGCFEGCSSLTEIIIPDSVTSIGNYAFRNCSSLTSVVIPNSVTSIGSSAFSGCDSLTEIVIPDSVTSIGSNAFAYCYSLTEIVIPDGVTSIDGSAFRNCSRLTSVVLPNSVTSIGSSAFEGCSSLTEIVIPDGVMSIGERVFSGCIKLTEITIPAYVYEIGAYAFSACSNLAKITILSQRLTKIGDHAFYGSEKLWEIYNLSPLEFTLGGTDFGGIAQYAKVIHTSLDETACVNVTEDGFITYSNGEENLLYGYAGKGGDIVLPENINGNTYEICANVFYNNDTITGVVIPDSVTSIGSYAFRNCDSLTSVVIGNGVTSIGNYAFWYCRSLTEIYYNATACADLLSADYVFSDAGQNGDGITVTIGANVTKIPAYLFCCGSSYYESKITKVVFEEGSVCESIGNGAVSGCDSLTEIVIPDSVTSISSSAFSGCDSLTEIVIPDGVTSIDSSAFAYCYSLTSVVIGNSVTTIGKSAFYSCDSLTSVYYKGTAEKWSNISIGSFNSDLTNAIRYYYSEATPALNADGTAYDGNYWHYDTDGITPVIWVCATEE